MSAEDFLRITPVELNWKVQAHNDATEERLLLDWRLGQLISFAFHDPKHYPKAPKSAAKQRISDEEIRRQAANIGMRIPES